MSFEVIFSPTARRDMQSIPPRIVPAIVEFVYGDLAASPRRVGKPLERELAGSYSARRGSYRVLYDIHEDQQRIVILRVDHRADVYRVR
ncbi:type II toxin-antitoxin system RelE family toxin [Agromyces albus]|uniref:Type II toxin-antitoxin system RelE/ParE family toxin n=1 Tax=Agromyces albus TaxID=205332 RepID=A0A4Q2L8A0_9MICO|nr:type II toxin-antitoxin system RelE/ParE family toxin [Agromyces albus]RXZ73280.1 type II toxin-antitoxin system RelE/ParE family toxin [Agromyces albus]